jgi:axial budding pattern protein 2
MVFLAIVLAFVHISYSTPAITFPINSQVPPVARVSEGFEFIFSDSTFASNAPSISYSLAHPPQWLRLDGTTRTLSGTPTTSDVGVSTFGLTAFDGSGSVSMGVTLLVTDNGGITLGAPILPQLEASGPTSSPSTLFLYPSDRFSFSFSPETFAGTSKRTNFYAISEDGSPLPSWLSFDARSLNFSGLTPPVVSPRATPEPFAIKLIASDYPGFASAIAPFQIIVASHILAFNSSAVECVVSKGGEFTSPPLRDGLLLDGKPVQNGQFVQVDGTLPQWLSLDRESLTLSGSPPDDTGSETVTIPVVDTYGDIANITMHLVFRNTLFNNGTFSTNGTIGRDFNYTIDPSILNGTSIQLDVDLGKASSWLTYNPDTMKLSGLTPRDLSPQNITLNLIATKGKISETERFVLSIIRGTGPLPLSTASAAQESGSPTQSPGPKPPISHSKTSTAERNRIIIASSVAPILCLIILLSLITFCLRRKKQHRLSVSDQQISRPQPLMAETNNAGDHYAAVTQGRTDFQRLQTPPRVPTIDLGKTWTQDTLGRSRLRSSRLAGDEEEIRGGLSKDTSFTVPHAISIDIPGFVESPKPAFKRQTRDLTPFRREITNHSRNRAPFRLTQSQDDRISPGKKRESKLLSKASSRLPGPLVSKRISAFGHGAGGLGDGAGTLGPPGYGNVRRSWKDTRSSITMRSEEGKERSMDSMIWSFPQPPKTEQPQPSGTNTDQGKRASIRLVRDQSFSRWSHATQFPDYIRQRAQIRQSNPLFSAGAVGSSTTSNRSPVFPDLNWNYAGRADRRSRRSDSQSSSIGPPMPPVKKPSRRNIGGRVNDDFSRLAYFRSEMSLASSRFDSVDSDDLSDGYADIVEAADTDGRIRWVKGSDRPGTQGPERSREGMQDRRAVDMQGQTLHVPTAGPPRPPRFSPLAAHPGDGSQPGEPPDEQKIRLYEERGKRPVSVDEGGLRRPIAGSQKGDIAFL